MLENYVGDDAWRAGVRAYLKAHAYGNAVTDDLWREIERAAAKPVVDIAHDFTRQPGIPLIRVERGACVGGATTLRLTQGEFAADRPGKVPLRWRVPVIARAVGQAPARTIVAGGSADLVVPGCGLVVVNAGQSGYFRTAYSADQQAALRDGFAGLDAVDQIGLVDDAWALGLAGAAPIVDAIELVQRASVDAAPELWSRIAERLTMLDAFYRGDPVRQTRWRAYAIERLAPVLARIGWQARDGEEAPVTVLRAELIEALGELGDAATIAEARRRYALRASDPAAYPVALRKSILDVVARHADVATWEALRAEARAASTPLVKDQLYRYLASARDEALAQRALEVALSDEPGATSSAAMVSEVADEHPDLAFDFAIARRERMNSLLAPESRNRYYPRLGAGSNDAAMVDKIRRFAEANLPASARRGAESAMARVGYGATIANERLGAVDAWLASRRP
jgi:aminopeptidase N